MIALAYVFDARVSKRVYKEPFGFDKAFSIIAESSGTHFDPALCSLFLQCRPEIEALYRSYTDQKRGWQMPASNYTAEGSRSYSL